MLVRALRSFAGRVTMTMGEVRDVEDTAAASLIRCGHAAAAGQAKEDNTDEAKRNKPAAGKGKAKGRS
ncbi:MAG: hypothetical protein ACI4KF_02555 [Huintestinicola sp.]